MSRALVAAEPSALLFHLPPSFALLKSCLPGPPSACAGVGEDRRVLSKSAQYRRLLKMYGGSTQEQQQQPLVADGEDQQQQQQQEAPRAKSGAANDGCEMCQFVVQYLKIALANNETMAQASIVAAAIHRLPVCLACLAAFIRLPLLQIRCFQPTCCALLCLPADPAQPGPRLRDILLRRRRRVQ